MEKIYQLPWEKCDFYKRSYIYAQENWCKEFLLKLALFLKQENGYILKNRTKIKNLRALSFLRLYFFNFWPIFRDMAILCFLKKLRFKVQISLILLLNIFVSIPIHERGRALIFTKHPTFIELITLAWMMMMEI